MRFSIPAVGTLLAIASAASASAIPVVARDTVQPPARYKLQTKVISDHKDTGTNKNGLWVYSTHTGAGLGDAALSSNRTVGWEAYLENEQQYFTYEGSIAGWPLKIAYLPYAAWNTATISISDSPGYQQGFYFTENGLQFNNTNIGWLACDWWRGTQLFNLNGYQSEPDVDHFPSSCSRVELYPVAI